MAMVLYPSSDAIHAILDHGRTKKRCWLSFFAVFLNLDLGAVRAVLGLRKPRLSGMSPTNFGDALTHAVRGPVTYVQVFSEAKGYRADLGRFSTPGSPGTSEAISRGRTSGSSSRADIRVTQDMRQREKLFLAATTGPLSSAHRG